MVLFHSEIVRFVQAIIFLIKIKINSRVWDAIHDPVLNTVEIVTITRKSCWFNQTIWNRLLTLFPQYGIQNESIFNYK